MRLVLQTLWGRSRGHRFRAFTVAKRVFSLTKRAFSLTGTSINIFLTEIPIVSV